jgi:Ca2+-binding EF-hand superfamily protein
MGAAGSVARDDLSLVLQEIRSQRLKPRDGSDIADYDSALLEIVKLRSLFNMIDIDEMEKVIVGKSPRSAAIQQSGESGQISAEEEQQLLLRGLAIVQVLRGKMEQRYDSLRETFLNIDVDKSGYISKNEFQEVG